MKTIEKLMFVSPNKITPLLQSINPFFLSRLTFFRKKIERINELEHITVPVTISGAIYFRILNKSPGTFNFVYNF